VIVHITCVCEKKEINKMKITFDLKKEIIEKLFILSKQNKYDYEITVTKLINEAIKEKKAVQEKMVSQRLEEEFKEIYEEESQDKTWKEKFENSFLIF
jgi:hypothetical protein